MRDAIPNMCKAQDLGPRFLVLTCLISPISIKLLFIESASARPTEPCNPPQAETMASAVRMP